MASATTYLPGDEVTVYVNGSSSGAAAFEVPLDLSIILGYPRATNLLALGFRVLHTAAYSCPDDTQLQLREHRTHLNERLAHRVNLPCAAIHGD